MTHLVSIDQLKVGIYIHLDLHWMEHPFGFGSFKIKSDEQIMTLRTLGLKQVRYEPRKSDVAPAPAPAAPSATDPAPPLPAADDPLLLAKRERQERLRRQREAIARVEKNFQNAANTVRNLQQALQTRPAQSVADSAKLVDQLVTEFLADNEVTIHAIGGRPGGAELYVHTLNVAVLCLLVAKELQLPAPAARLLGLGALFHDIGLLEVSSRILRNTDPLTAPERAAREMHCAYGLARAKTLGLAPEVQKIVAQHHELADGSGYPMKLKGEAIAPLARIVALVNQYDNLCNPVNIARALTPHETLSHIFTQQKTKFDARVMQSLIRCLGVYPPGTVVTLSNDAVCMVTSVNASRPLKPTVLVYDAKTPRHEPMILDLKDEADINIKKALRPAQLAPEVLEYLAVRSRVSYFFDTSAVAQ